MAAEIGHPCFEPPVDQDIKIWRYMDFTKYVALLESSGLFFARSDYLNDPYEGALSHANIRLRPEVYKESDIPDHAWQQMSQFAYWVRQWTFINCWHMSSHESAAMWKLYAQTDEAVAIQSTYRELHGALPSGTYLGAVHYIDYETEWLPEGNTFWPFVHKRRSFEHEKEIRAVAQEIPKNEEGIDNRATNQEAGRVFPIALNTLIHHVYVSPTAPQWFSSLVDEVTRRYGMKFEVSQSSLAKQPVF